MPPKDEEENYKNYGSVDLNDGDGLPPNWKREDQDYSLISTAIVGHVNGKADAFLSKKPRERHQFVWVSPSDPEGTARKKMHGYAPVTDADWTINESLWLWEADDKRPDGPKFCVRFGDRLWARPEARYWEDRERRERKTANLNQVVNDRLAAHPGAGAARDQDGNKLVPTTRTAAHAEL